MNRSAIALVLFAVLGVVGSVLPWFVPRYPGLASDVTWHAWSGKLGLVPGVIALVAGFAGALMIKESRHADAGNSDTIDGLVRRLSFTPVLGLAACAWVWFRFPEDVSIAGCNGYGCSITPGSWVDEPGASRGTQLGFWLVVVSSLGIMAAGLLASRGRERAVESAIQQYREPEYVPPPDRSRTSRASGVTGPATCIAQPRHATAPPPPGRCPTCFPARV